MSQNSLCFSVDTCLYAYIQTLFYPQNAARLAIFYEVYYILTRRYGKSSYSNNNFAQFAAKTRHTAIHVAIQNRIQHIAKLQSLSSTQVCTHCKNFLTYKQESHILDAAASIDCLC